MRKSVLTLLFLVLFLYLYFSVSLDFSANSLIFITMFDFQKLDVYQKSKAYNKTIKRLLLDNRFNRVVNDQLRRASLSIMLNIAESSSRFSNKDRKNLLVNSRGSVFECAAIMEYLYETSELEHKEFEGFTLSLEEISRMLFTLIRKLE